MGLVAPVAGTNTKKSVWSRFHACTVRSYVRGKDNNADKIRMKTYYRTIALAHGVRYGWRLCKCNFRRAELIVFSSAQWSNLELLREGTTFQGVRGGAEWGDNVRWTRSIVRGESPAIIQQLASLVIFHHCIYRRDGSYIYHMILPLTHHTTPRLITGNYT
jgi:hypothetical protein